MMLGGASAVETIRWISSGSRVHNGNPTVFDGPAPDNKHLTQALQHTPQQRPGLPHEN